MSEVLSVVQREAIYLWYYFDVQLRQILPYWAFGIIIGSLISVFAKGKIHKAVAALGKTKLGVLGIIPASLLGIVSPLCMYGTIPIAASLAKCKLREDWIAAFMMSSILLNPQLLIYSAALGAYACTLRLLFCTFGGTIPLLNQWLKNGMSMGAGVSFMITGPSTKITNLSALKTVLGVKHFFMYIGYVIVYSIASGFITDYILGMIVK